MDHMLQRLICLQIVLYDLKKPGGFNVTYTSVSVIYLALLQIRFLGPLPSLVEKKNVF